MTIIESKSFEDRTARLPVWARDELRNARRREEDLRAQIAVLNGDEPSLVNVTRFHMADRPLGDQAIVRFTLSDHAYVDVRLETDARGRCVYIMGQGHGGVTVQPHASNVITVHVAEGR